MTEIEVFQKVMEKLQELELIDLQAFEVDIVKLRRQLHAKDEYDLFEINKKLDDIYDKHTEKVRSLGYAKQFGNLYIADIYPKLDDDNTMDLDEYEITQSDIFSYLFAQMEKIEKKHLDISYPIMLEHDSSENLLVPRLDKIAGIVEKRIDAINGTIDQFVIETAASTLFETYQKLVYTCAFYEDTIALAGIIEKSLVRVKKDRLIGMDKNLQTMFQSIVSRQIEHRGKIDKGMRIEEKLELLESSLTRLRYSLRRSHRYEKALQMIQKNELLEIHKVLEKYDYNYIGYEIKGYDLFERLIEFVIELQDDENRNEKRKSYDKLNNAIKKLEESLSGFDTITFNFVKNPAIEGFMSIGKNQVLGYAAVVFERYFDIDKEKTRGLLNYIFSKAEENIQNEKNTNQGKNYYEDISFKDGYICIEIMVPQFFFRDSDWVINY